MLLRSVNIVSSKATRVSFSLASNCFLRCNWSGPLALLTFIFPHSPRVSTSEVLGLSTSPDEAVQAIGNYPEPHECNTRPSPALVDDQGQEHLGIYTPPRMSALLIGTQKQPGHNWRSMAYPIAVGTVITDRPPHRSVRAQLRHTAPTLGGDGEADARPWVKNLGLREKVIGQLCDPLPCQVILLTAAPQRAQPEAHNMVAKGAECREVSRHGVIGKVAPNDLRQPTPLIGDRLVHSPP